MTRRRDVAVTFLFGLCVAVLVAAGIGVRATYGAQTTADEPQYLLSALSLWEDGDLDISDELERELYREFHQADLPRQTTRREDGSQISPHDPLLPLLAAVPIGLGGWVGVKLALAGLGGALAATTSWVARHRLGVSRMTAFVVAALFALSPPLAMYATQVYPEIAAALLLLIGTGAVLGRLRGWGAALFASCVIALPWLAVKYVPLAAVLAVVGTLRVERRWRPALAAVFALAGLGYVVGHLTIYGGLTAYASGDHFVGGEFTAVGRDVSLWGRSTRVLGLLVDRGFGIAAWQPAYLLLPVALGWAAARRTSDLKTLSLLIGTGWLVASFVALTMHGWWFPGRQIVVVLPLGALLISLWADRRREKHPSPWIWVGVLGVVAGVFLVSEGLSGDLTWVVDFGSTSSPIYRAVSAMLPDYMRPGTATWVLHGVWVALLAGLLWLGWRDGSRDRGEGTETGLDTRRERVWT